MKDDPTILDDRETVELLSARPELLAIADAVRATQRKEARAWAPRARFLLAAAALVALSAVFALAFSGNSGVHKPRESRHNFKVEASGSGKDSVVSTPSSSSYQPSPDQLDYIVTRTDGAISSIAVTVRGEVADSTAHLQVRMQGTHSSGAGRVVFSRTVSLNSTPSPPVRGLVSEWTGTLSPSDWDGGCQDAVYWLVVHVPNQGSTPGYRGITVIQPPAFDCQREAPASWSVVGPTGGSGPAG